MISGEKTTVLITGASSGFGKSTSELLANSGYRVFGTSRSPEKLGVSKNVEMLQLDVTSDESVASCVSTLLQKTNGKLDVLVNNAGILKVGGIEEMPLEEMKEQLETNLFGAIRMIKAVLPVMRQKRRGQIINVGSMAGQIAVPFEGVYCVSKFALEGVSEQLRHETKNLGINVSIVEPGFFKTNLFKDSRGRSATIEDYKEMEERVLARLYRFDQEGQDPIAVAETILKIIREKNPKLRYAVGKEKSGLLYKRIIPQTMFENQFRRIFEIDKASVS